MIHVSFRETLPTVWMTDMRRLRHIRFGSVELKYMLLLSRLEVIACAGYGPVKDATVVRPPIGKQCEPSESASGSVRQKPPTVRVGIFQS